MDCLEPWLAGTIEGALSEALRRWEDGTNTHQSIDNSRGLSYDDGSNLRIPSTKKGSVVQITKFLTFEEPIQVTLSDSVIRVNASITNQASQRYAEKNRKKLTEGTVGGLIQLLEFEIVATHLGPRDKRLTLYVKDFKSLGSNGSGSFGVAPQAIESREGTKELLVKLADLRRHGLDAHSEQSATASPIRSQPSTQTSEAVNYQDSQFGFATQVFRSNASTVSKPKPPDPTTIVNISSTATANSAKSLTPPTKRTPGNPLANTLSTLHVQAAPQKPSVSGSKNLLGVLQRYKRATPAPKVSPEPTTEQPPRRTTASIGPNVTDSENEASRDITLAASDDNGSKPPIGSQKRKRHSPDDNRGKKAADNNDFNEMDKNRKSLAVNHDLDGEASSGAVVTGASIHTPPIRPVSPSTFNSAKLLHNSSLEPSVDSILKVQSSASSQNTSRNRIRSRDVHIPKDQEALLNRADSWLPAEPGQREPTANIPISLLKKLNEKADIHAQRPTKIRKRRKDTVTRSAVIDQTADSESDVPVSSGRWPASPERDQLPPDSSLPSADHFDHSVPRMSNNPLSVSSSRRPSHASASSYSMPPARPSLTRVPKESGSPSMVSPGALSPSVASAASGEEGHRFTCQAPGCEKSYKNPGGLNYHVDRYHPSTGSFESFKCPVKECNKLYASSGGLKYHIQHHDDSSTAPPSRDESAIPTISGDSSPMFADFTSRSERDRGSQRKVLGSRVDNELDNVEVSPPISPLLGQEAGTPRGEEAVKGRSRTNSPLKSNLRPDAQPAPSQSVLRYPDETHVAKESFSPLLPASATPESDLEMTVPHALNATIDSTASSAQMQHFPSTASGSQGPFTQVKRTPYVNAHLQNQSLSGSPTLSSPLKADFDPPANSTTTDDIEFVSASVTSGQESSTRETNGGNKSVNIAADQDSSNVAARLTKESNSQNLTDSSLGKYDNMIAEVQQVSRKAGAPAGKSEDPSIIVTGSRSQNLGLIQQSVAVEANAKTHGIPEKLRTPDDNHTNPCASDHAPQISHETKRKCESLSFESPRVAKRHKKFKVPSAFTFAERSDVPRNPSEGARQYRQEFLASRRGSGSSTPAMSPTIPPAGFAGTTSGNLRDPSERAWQTGQQFLASRSGSEISTPTASPRKHFAALTGTIQDESWNAEVVEKDVGKVNLRKQSVDTEIERQKMTEVKDLSPRSQTHQVELDVAALQNGIASRKLDGDDAKPGAQDNPSLNNDADSVISVAQDTYVNGPGAEEGIEIEASPYTSKDAAQRAQSVELDVSIQTSDRPEAENDIANAKDDADQTANRDDSVMVVSHDRLANTNENGRPAELDKGHMDILTRGDEVAEQGVNAPISGQVFDQLAEPDTATLQPVYQPRSEVDVDTQMPDQSESQPTPERQVLTVDADTPMPDKIAMKPASQQHLVGEVTDTSVRDGTVDQDTTPLKPVGHTDEPMDQPTALSVAAPALVAESNTEDRRLSPAAAESAVPPTDSMSDSKADSVREHEKAVQLPTDFAKQKPSLVSQSIFDKFKATYPVYPGDMRHFSAICRKISQLAKTNRMEHQSLWDDFIIRHKIEYALYLRRCAEEAEDAVPYEDFYQNQVEGPQYQMRVITRRNLEEALALSAPRPIYEQVHLKPTKNDETLAESAKDKSATKEVTFTGIQQKPSEGRVTIDLTEDDPPDNGPKSTTERELRPQWGVSHLVEGVSASPQGLQYRRESSGSLHQVPHASSAVRGSRVPPPSQSTRSPPVHATGATRSTGKSVQRSLPWIGPDHGFLHSSPTATARRSPKGFLDSDVAEVRAKRSSNPGGAHLHVSAKSTPNGPMQNQRLLNTCHKVIQSKWGIKAHELLEPEYYRGQVLSETMIELMAEIASKVKVGEARDRIKEVIDTRIRLNSRRGAGSPGQDRKIFKSDLEVVRGAVETSCMSTTSPLSLPHTNAAVEKQIEGTPSRWWDDDNSPFRSFARAYTSIRQGNGNSFAQADSSEPGEAEKVHEAAGSGVRLKKINIMRWNL